jgi:choline dehydrogenase-like flavoprotein
MDNGNNVVSVGAEKEVILCMGTVGSPQALMASGIGPADQLQVARSARSFC